VGDKILMRGGSCMIILDEVEEKDEIWTKTRKREVIICLITK